MIKLGGVKFLLVIFLFQIFALSILFFSPHEVKALEFNPQIEIPGAESGYLGTVPDDTSMTAKYIKAIYQYGIGVVGILAAIILMFGGLLWLTAGGDAGRVSEAKEWIKASILGLIIALASYTILQTINPDLVNFRSLAVSSIKSVSVSSSLTTRDQVYIENAKQTNDRLSKFLESATPVNTFASNQKNELNFSNSTKAYSEYLPNNMYRDFYLNVNNGILTTAYYNRTTGDFSYAFQYKLKSDIINDITSTSLSEGQIDISEYLPK